MSASPSRSFAADDSVERVRAATDIVDLVGRYVPLRRGGAAFKGLCPFHQEKSPSFHVNPARQIFKCFGCGQGGDVFSFLMKIEKLAFPDALRQLAERAGIELKPPSPEELVRRDVRKDLHRALDWAQRVFVRDFESEEGAACRAYVAGRGIGPELVRAFGLGFAAAGGRRLVSYAGKMGVPLELLERAGLVLKGDGGERRDRFRGRLTFPIRDRQGRVVAFGARSLDGSEPKYLNSPETELFHKGRTLYGLDLLVGHDHRRPVLVMEGYTDVILSRQAGLTGAVATLGTAFTPAHAAILRAHADRVVLVYDGDAAGLAAAARAAPLLLDEGLSGGVDLRVATLPDGEDPADFFVKRGAAGLAELERHVVELADFVLARCVASHDLSSLVGLKRAAEEAAGYVARVRDDAARAAFGERAARAVGVPVPTFAGMVRAARERAVAEERRRAERGAAEASADGAAATRRSDEAWLAFATRGERKACEALLTALLNWPSAAAPIARRIRPEMFGAAPAGPVVTALARVVADFPDVTTPRLLDVLGDEDARDFAARRLTEEPPPSDLDARLEAAAALLEDAARLPEAERLKERNELTRGAESLQDYKSLLTSDILRRRIRRQQRGRA